MFVQDYTKTFVKIPTWQELIEADRTAYRTRKIYKIMRENLQAEIAEQIEEKEK